jgi:glycolate oxidase iron-sulfur subunit
MRAKVADVAATGAEVMVSANPGCMLQLAAGLRSAGSGMRVMHIAEVLAAALKRG